jgi:hypothetical protein
MEMLTRLGMYQREVVYGKLLTPTNPNGNIRSIMNPLAIMWTRSKVSSFDASSFPWPWLPPIREAIAVSFSPFASIACPPTASGCRLVVPGSSGL